MTEKQSIDAKNKVVSSLSSMLGEVGGQLGELIAKGSDVIQAEVNQVDANEDLTREWKIILRPQPTSQVIFQRAYWQEIEAHTKTLDDARRIMQKERYQDSCKTSEQRSQELIAAIRLCDYDHQPVEK